MFIYLAYLVLGVLALVQLPQTSFATLSVDSSCVKKIMNDCNSQAKGTFLANSLSQSSDTDKYCQAMKNLHECVAKHTNSNSCPETDTLTKYYFIVLAYLRTDNLMGSCTAIDLSNIQDTIVYKAKQLYDYKGSSMERFVNGAIDRTPPVGQSFKGTHTTCIDNFSKKEQNTDQFCGGLNDFIACYRNNPANDEKLYVVFMAVIDSLSKAFIDLYDGNDMCTKTDVA